jgi:hypothetical protein
VQIGDNRAAEWVRRSNPVALGLLFSGLAGQLQNLILLLLCSKVYGIKLFGVVFALFSTDSNSASNFAVYETHVEFFKIYFLLTLALFADFKAKIVRNGLKKNEKCILYVCLRIPFYIYFRSWRLNFSKSQNRCTQMYSVYTELEFLNNLWGL